LRRIIGRPSNKGDLVPRPLATLEFILDVKDGIATADTLLSLAVLALGIEQLFTEPSPVALGARLLNDNLFPVIADLVDDVFERLAQLEVIEGGDALGGYGDAAPRSVVVERERNGARGYFWVQYGDGESTGTGHLV
jgi:hypothetical protein